MAELTQNRYGKSLVKVLRVFRNGDHHDIRDLNVQVLLQGDHLEESYFTGDNSFIVPTDTVKNTVFYLAKTNPPKDIESFGVTIGRHFINEYPHIHAVDIDIVEKPWSRINVDGKPHQHSFIPDAEERTASIKVTRKALDRPQVVSGLRNLLVLKTTNSEFVGFSKCKYTTLKEAKDRIFKTTVTANWSYGRLGSHSTVDYNAIYDQVKKNIFKVFATTYSKAVQQTIWDMGREILANVDEIQEVFFALPNQHNWTWDGTPFGVTNANEVFIPQADPSGLIEGTISRKHLARL